MYAKHAGSGSTAAGVQYNKKSNGAVMGQSQNQNGRNVTSINGKAIGAAATNTNANTRSKPMSNETMGRGDKVWVADPKEGFVRGEIVDLGVDKVTVLPVESSKSQQTYGRKSGSGRGNNSIEIPYDYVYPAEDNSTDDYDDNCSLMYLNEATLLHNVRLRYNRSQIYTYIANMLIAINPYVELKGLYSGETIKRYQGKSLGTLPPHVFAIGDKAFRDMKVTKQSQSIIVSGESGSGKTESTKYILRYLCGSWGSSAGTIEQKILDANPVMESFGNAKTTRNNNSSRFGKFIEIHFEKNHKVTGGYISHYLLEKSRICTQSPEERNYHIFYQLLAGAPSQLKQALKLDKLGIDSFYYLRQGCRQFFGTQGTLKDPIVDDARGFGVMDGALSSHGLSEAERRTIYTVVSGVLHLGNVGFEDDPDDQRGGCRVTDQAETALKIASGLMGVDPDDLRRSLTFRAMQTAKGGSKGTVIMVPLKVHEANSARNALAKAMYSKLFDYIVYKINQSIPLKDSVTYIGVLDIAGFEFFTLNSFEQFCINYCNEKLQQFFNERVLSDEQNLYEREGLGVGRIEFIDNTDCIDLIESPKNGILSLLDEESKLPKPSSAHFTSEVHKTFPTHFRLALPRKSKIKEHREIGDEEGFLIRHFAGAVCYNTVQFIEKNNDALHASLEGLVQESKNTFLQGLFALATSGSSNNSVFVQPPPQQQRGKLTHESVGSKFRSQLIDLLEKLRGTGTSFIRCIKPNAKMVPNEFEGGQILSQLQSAGMTSVLELMQKGFPSRVHFSSLYATYKALLPPRLSSLDPRFFCRALFKALGLSEDDFKFGLTRVFFRPGKFKEFDQLMRNDPESLVQMVSTVTRWIVQAKWKKAQYCALSAIKLKNKIAYRRENLVIIQKTVRMHFARKRHRPRYQGIVKVKKLGTQITAMGQTVQKLKKDREVSQKEVQNLQSDLNKAVVTIKSNERMQEKDIEKLYRELLVKCESLIKTLSQRVDAEKDAEEKEKARKVREEMERQKKEREEQERKKMEEEEHKKQKAEIEARRKREAEEAAKRESAQQKQQNVNGKIPVVEDTVMARFADAAAEQDRRDTELAFRLAQESSNVTVDVQDMQLKRSNYILANRANKKHDLSGWKYSDLRDTINTSCDVELLEACREEFHRRLKVYHAWKAKNRGGKNGVTELEERAPKSIYQHCQSHNQTPSPTPPANGVNQQRYFRIPFTKDGQNKGLWYAHFDGQYIARQMEVHPGKPPVLMVAGRDDMNMCELKLSETGLTRKRGAEILEYDFEKEWDKNGGDPYMKPAERPERSIGNLI